MRILLVAGSYPPMPCGVGDYIALLARELGSRPGYKVAVLADARAAGGPEGAGVELFPVVRSWRLPDLGRMRQVVRAWKPDVVHLQYPAHGFGPRLLSRVLLPFFRALGVPVVESWHEHWPSGAWRIALGAPFATHVVVPRAGWVERMPRWARPLVARKRFHEIPSGPTMPAIRLPEPERAALRAVLGADGRAIVAYFGFSHPNKGVEQLFEVADPSRHHLVLVTTLDSANDYQKALLERTQRSPWAGHVTVTGFLHAPEVARLLAAADAVVLPFREGSDTANSTLHSAVVQGTFAVTTSRATIGYDPDQHVHRVRPGDVAGMRSALDARLGQRRSSPPSSDEAWKAIADAHLPIYDAVTRHPRMDGQTSSGTAARGSTR